MEIGYNEIANQPWMFVWVAIIITAVIAQCLIYMKRAWRRAEALGLDDSQIRKGLTTGIGVSILPTLPVLIVLLTLIPLMGTPLPWLRLSVIGSAMYETLAATTGVNSVGENLVVNGYSAYAWSAAAWTMSFGASTCVLWSALATKPSAMVYEQIERFDIGLVLAVGAGCMAGVLAFTSTRHGFSAMPTKGVVFCSSFAFSVLFMIFSKKFPKRKWLADFNMALSMIVGMIVACVTLG